MQNIAPPRLKAISGPSLSQKTLNTACDSWFHQLMPSILLLIEWAHPENRSKRHDHAVSEALANPEFVFQKFRPIGGIYNISIVRAQRSWLPAGPDLRHPKGKEGTWPRYICVCSLTHLWESKSPMSPAHPPQRGSNSPARSNRNKYPGSLGRSSLPDASR